MTTRKRRDELCNKQNFLWETNIFNTARAHTDHFFYLSLEFFFSFFPYGLLYLSRSRVKQFFLPCYFKIVPAGPRLVQKTMMMYAKECLIQLRESKVFLVMEMEAMCL